MNTSSSIIQALFKSHLKSHPQEVCDGAQIEQHGPGLIFVPKLGESDGKVFFDGKYWNAKSSTGTFVSRVQDTKVFYRDVTGPVREFIKEHLLAVGTTVLFKKPEKFCLKFKLQRVKS